MDCRRGFPSTSALCCPTSGAGPLCLARGFLEVHQGSQGTHGAHAGVIDGNHGAVGDHRGVVHGLDAGAIRLGGDVAVLEIDLHPLVGGLRQLLLQNLPAQEFPVLHADGGNFPETLILQQVAQSDGLQMALDVRDSLIGVLKPDAIARSDGNVANGRETPAGGPDGVPFRVFSRQLQIYQAAGAGVVVVGRSQCLDDAGLDPLPTPALVPDTQGGDDATHSGLAGVPATRVHRRIHWAVPVGLTLQVEHSSRFGRDDTFVTLHPPEGAILPEARDGAINQTRVNRRQVVIR